MTLIELMLVMVVVAIALGVSVGVFTQLDLAQRTATSLVQNALRSTRNWAVAEGADARIRLDAATGQMFAHGSKVIGTWHFETLPTQGAFELDGAHKGGYLVDDGFQGKALSFDGEPSGASMRVPVEHESSYDLEGGFRLACHLRVDGPGSARVLTLGKNVLTLDVGDNGLVRVSFVSRMTNELGVIQAGGKVIVESDAGALEAGRWTKVEASYDRREFRLLIDGVVVDRREETAPVHLVEGPLVLSGGRRPFPGSIDNLVLRTMGKGQEFQLPEGVSFTPEAPTSVHFQPNGRLDTRVHKQPLLIDLEFQDGRRERIRVNLMGTVE